MFFSMLMSENEKELSRFKANFNKGLFAFLSVFYYTCTRKKKRRWIETMNVKPDKKLIQRLNRVEGQIGGIKRMIEAEENCQDVIAQVNAARSALDRIAGYIVAKNLEQCMLEYPEGEREEAIEQAVNLLIKTKR